MPDQRQKSEDRNTILLSDVSDGVLRAWLDAGIMTAAEYHNEQKLRLEKSRKQSPDQ